MRVDLRLLAALALAGAFAAPSVAWSGPPASPTPPAPPPKSGSGAGNAEEPIPGGGTTLPGTRQQPGERPGPGTTPPAPKTPAPPSSPPPPGGNAPAAPPAEPEPPAKPVDLSETWGYSKSRPITPRYTRTEEDPGFTPANPGGFYSGVSTRGNQVPPIPPADFKSRPALMTWAGFERAPEGSRVYFQLNGPVQHEMHQDGLVLKVRMRNTKVNVKNNARRLDTRYFETPVREVRVRRVGKDTEATIELKRAASPTVQLVDGKGGYKLLTVQFDDARPGAGAGGGAGADPYRSAGGGGYVGGDTTEPQRTGGAQSGANAAGTGDGGQGGASGDAATAGAAGQPPDAAVAGPAGAGSQPDRAGWFPLDLYVVSHD